MAFAFKNLMEIELAGPICNMYGAYMMLMGTVFTDLILVLALR